MDIRRFSHDGGDSSYLYRSVESFCAAQAMTGLKGFPYDEAPGRDYPPTSPWSPEQTAQERLVVATLWEELNSEPYIPYDPAANTAERDENRLRVADMRLRIADIILALTPYEDSDTLLPLLDDGSSYIQGHTCENLARRGYTPAIPYLITVAQRGPGSGAGKAIDALKRIGTPDALEGLRFLTTVVTDRDLPWVKNAIKALEST